ncbi:MAG: class I SAM-dependent methyltransferase [Phycisphaerales bacterium]|nr:class I SAM-dependent methyltransferase [Phycisphaerales bacterium]
MNRDLYSATRHAGLEFASPLPRSSYTTLLRGVLDGPPGIAIDIGCGKGSLLGMLAERGWTGIGLERSPLMAAEARRLAARRGLEPQMRVIEGDARVAADAMADASVDLAACVGSAHALGSLETTMAQMRRLVRPGGYLLLGDLYWRRPPAPALLQALEMPADAIGNLLDLFSSPIRAGLSPLGCLTTTPAEFHTYEATQREAAVAWHAANPSHPDAGEILAQTERWWRLYESYTRDAFGFALCLFASPG